jgi:hypothetical protein
VKSSAGSYRITANSKLLDYHRARRHDLATL